MRKIIAITIGILAVLVVLALASPYFFSVETFKKPLMAELEKIMGHKVTVGGQFSLHFYPFAGATLENVSIEGSDPKTPLITLKLLEVDVGLFDMIVNHEVTVKKLHLDEPSVSLFVDVNGKGNWEKISETLGSNGAPVIKSTKPSLPKLSLDDMVITKGTLHYVNAKTKSDFTFSKLELKASLEPKKSTFSASGSTEFDQHSMSYKFTTDSLQRLVAGLRTAVTLQVKNDMLSLDTSGNYENLVYNGHIKAVSSSLKSLILQMNDIKYLDDIKAKLALDTEGDIQCSMLGCSYTKASINLDEIKTKGDISFTQNARPLLTINLAAGDLDLNPYLPEKHAPQVRNFSLIANAEATEQKSSNPIYLSGLKAFDGTIIIKDSGLKIGKLSVGKNMLRAKLNNGHLAFDSIGTELYSGQCDIIVNVDSTLNPPSFQQILTLNDVQAEPLLAATAGTDRITGTLEVKSDVIGRGRSTDEIISQLDGSGTVEIKDGSIKNINIVDMARNLQSSFNGGSQGSGKTDFSILSGSFTMKSGVATNNDLKLISAQMNATGAGQINLPAWSVNYHIIPQLGGEKGLAVPFSIKGSLNNPQFAPDVKAAATDFLKNPDNYKKKNLQNTLKGFRGLLKGNQ